MHEPNIEMLTHSSNTVREMRGVWSYGNKEDTIENVSSRIWERLMALGIGQPIQEKVSLRSNSEQHR